jgi:hypothetical protein
VDTNGVLAVEDGVFVLHRGRVSKQRARQGNERTWPAVSIMSQSYSTPLQVMLFVKLDSMVG